MNNKSLTLNPRTTSTVVKSITGLPDFPLHVLEILNEMRNRGRSNIDTVDEITKISFSPLGLSTPNPNITKIFNGTNLSTVCERISNITISKIIEGLLFYYKFIDEVDNSHDVDINTFPTKLEMVKDYLSNVLYTLNSFDTDSFENQEEQKTFEEQKQSILNDMKNANTWSEFIEWYGNAQPLVDYAVTNDIILEQFLDIEVRDTFIKEINSVGHIYKIVDRPDDLVDGKLNDELGSAGLMEFFLEFEYDEDMKYIAHNFQGHIGYTPDTKYIIRIYFGDFNSISGDFNLSLAFKALNVDNINYLESDKFYLLTELPTPITEIVFMSGMPADTVSEVFADYVNEILSVLEPIYNRTRIEGR